jgi:phytol kinase
MEDKRKRELLRKSVHISSLLMPFGYRYIFHNDRKLMFLVLVPLALIALIIETFRQEHKTFKSIFYKTVGFMLRKHEIHNFTGATYLMISTIICIAIFPSDIAFLALCFLAIGDTLAAVIGISFGKRKLFGTKKSLEGSIACFVSSFLFGIFFVSPIIAFFGAFAATVAEFSELRFDDNIKIPLISGAVMMFVSLFV